MMAQLSNIGQNMGQGSGQQKVVEEEPDTTPLWQGMNVKLDLGNTVYTLATTRAKRQQYEIALNCNLKNKYYPTLELGYGLSHDIAGGGNYDGQGGFMKLGSRVYAMIRVSSTPASERAKAVVSAVFLRGNERDDMLF